MLKQDNKKRRVAWKVSNMVMPQLTRYDHVTSGYQTSLANRELQCGKRL